MRPKFWLRKIPWRERERETYSGTRGYELLKKGILDEIVKASLQSCSSSRRRRRRRRWWVEAR